ncbi:MAG: acetyltransferase [Anaerolineae bacterium]|nr:acetyltransferase [Anaerolineae bacterium]
MKPDGVFLIGGGGHAKVVVATLRSAGHRVAGVFDDDPNRQGRSVLGVPVLGSIEQALNYKERGPFVIAIGDNRTRKSIAERFESLEWMSVVHPAAQIHSSVEIAPGAVVFAGVVIQPDVVIGEHTILNTGCTVDHDCTIGPFAHITPGAHLAGAVHVGEGAFLGIGSSVVPNQHIGTWAVVGAGGTVVRDVPDKTLVVGVPAKVVRILGE